MIVCTVLPISPAVSVAAILFLSIVITTSLLRTARLSYVPLNHTLGPSPSCILLSPIRILPSNLQTQWLPQNKSMSGEKP